MATLAQTVPSPSLRANWNWIISKRVDVPLVVGSPLAGYLYLLLNLALHVPISFLWWFWSVGFDGTHIFAMASRTYFDAEVRRSRRMLLFGSLAFFFSLGPAMVLMGGKGYLALLVGVWAYYHVIRQHYGFMVLYKVKNRDFSRLDNMLDRVFLGVMMIYPPFHRFLIHHPEELGIPRGFPASEPYIWTLAGLTAAVYLARQAARFRSGDPVNVPKYLLLGGVISLHWLTFATMSWQAAVPTVTIAHNLQYHALIWFHNRNRYGGPSGEHHGRIPRAVAQSLAGYIGIALLFSALYRVPGFQLGRISDLAFGFFCGFGLTHYYLDSHIWRVRQDPGLREALRLA